MAISKNLLISLILIGITLPMGDHVFAKQNQLLIAPKKVVRISAHKSPPIMLIEDGKKPQGFMVDFLDEIALRENWTIEWVIDEWSNLHTKAKNNELDLMVFIAYDEKRAEYLDFSNENFITGWGQVYSHDSNTFQSLFDFENKEVAILKNGIHGIAFKDLCDTFEVNCLIKDVPNYGQAFQMLQNKQVDGVVSGNWIGHNYLNQYNIAPTSIIYNPKDTLFAVPKGTNSELLKTIDRYVANWRADKSSPYYAAHDKWIHQHSDGNIPKWLTTVLLLITGLLLASAFITYILRKQVNKQTLNLKRQSQQIRQIIDLIPHFIYAANDKGEIYLMNQYAAEFCGLELKNYDTLPKAQLIETYGANPDLFNGDSSLLKRGAGKLQSELHTKNATGNYKYLDLIKVPFVSNTTDTQSLVCVGVDITEAKTYEQQIKHMAYHDPLTQLPNRILLNDRLKQSLALAVRQGYSGAILLIDVDDFKTFNHKYGQIVGDKTLQKIANKISSLVKSGDTVARLNSDTFVVQLNELSINPDEANNSAFKVASQIQEVISAPHTIDGSSVNITASIGIVIYPFDGKNASNIIPRAESAMRHAKANDNKNIVRFISAMETAVFQRHLINQELQAAISNNEFTLYYQPQFYEQENLPIGFEALLRWEHHKHGLIYPADFIAAAEESNLIISLGYWVIERAFSDLRKLQNTSLRKSFFSINLSVIQIKDPNLVPLIKSLLKQYAIEPSLIEFEITETVLFQDVDDSIDTLTSIKSLGCKISIDDFGTGYSSLSYINKLPLDKLKIDHSFIKDIHQDRSSQAIVKTIVNMAKDLGLNVLAEGVEEEAQLNYLKSIKCQYYQGYYFKRAVPLSEIINTYNHEQRHRTIGELENNLNI